MWEACPEATAFLACVVGSRDEFMGFEVDGLSWKFFSAVKNGSRVVNRHTDPPKRIASTWPDPLAFRHAKCDRIRVAPNYLIATKRNCKPLKRHTGIYRMEAEVQEARGERCPNRRRFFGYNPPQEVFFESSIAYTAEELLVTGADGTRRSGVV
ncbi:hypothetical protein AAG570_012741 [Ranatra chinensis]|uniref:Uncharacterized protein n=1 Tax=Ranatra chinensis TaxID=642074 RepID=A0ABD0YEV1_9HEMI